MAVTIYKYIKPEHLDLFFSFGRIKIGTLFDYRREEEYGAVIGDREEGQIKSIFENPPSEFELGDGSPEANYFKEFIPIQGDGNKISFEQGARIVTPINSPNYYIFCASLKFDPDVMARYGGACIEILDAKKFFAEISLIMKIKRKTSFQGFYPIVYCNREIDYKQPQNIHPALIKDEKRKKDNEVRAIWKTNGNEIREQFIYISATKAVKWCQVYTSHSKSTIFNED